MSFASQLEGSFRDIRKLINTKTPRIDITGMTAAGITAAIAGQSRVILTGDASVAGTILITHSIRLDMALATITQTAPLTPLFDISGDVRILVRNPDLRGLRTDYVNAASVISACAFNTRAGARLKVRGGQLLGFAGHGVLIRRSAARTVVERVEITGAGAEYITTPEHNFSGGVGAANDDGQPTVLDSFFGPIDVDRCEISGFAQGFVSADNLDVVSLTNNYIHDIPGQHGFYIGSARNLVVAGNRVKNTTLNGMKVQIGSAQASDARNITIAGNVFTDYGMSGIHCLNSGGGAGTVKNLIVNGNAVTTTKTTDPLYGAIDIRHSDGLTVSNNVIDGGNKGIYIATSTNVKVDANRVANIARQGVHVFQASDIQIRSTRITNPCGIMDVSARSAVLIENSTDVTVEQADITDTSGTKMRFGILVSDHSLATHAYRNVRVTGATEYGFRGPGTAGNRATARAFQRVGWSGGIGGVLDGPAVATEDTQAVASIGALASGGEWTLADLPRALRSLKVGSGAAGIAEPVAVTLDGRAGQPKQVLFNTAGVARWLFRAGSAAEDTEPTGTTGSPFEIMSRRNDGGVGSLVFSAERNGDTRLGAVGGKLGFYGGTPVAKGAALTAATATAFNSGDAATDAAMENVRVRVNELQARLQALGLIS